MVSWKIRNRPHVKKSHVMRKPIYKSYEPQHDKPPCGTRGRIGPTPPPLAKSVRI